MQIFQYCSINCSHFIFSSLISSTRFPFRVVKLENRPNLFRKPPTGLNFSIYSIRRIVKSPASIKTMPNYKISHPPAPLQYQTNPATIIIIYIGIVKITGRSVMVGAGAFVLQVFHFTSNETCSVHVRISTRRHRRNSHRNIRRNMRIK